MKNVEEGYLQLEVPLEEMIWSDKLHHRLLNWLMHFLKHFQQETFAILDKKDIGLTYWDLKHIELHILPQTDPWN